MKCTEEKALQEYKILDLPATTRPHVSQQYENVIENLQVHEHPDR